ncbi:hypothetical protein LINPERHAP1_LOCUS35803 [Linum perenne]
MNFWREKWIDDGTVLSGCITPHAHQESKVIEDFLNPEGEWDIPSLSVLVTPKTRVFIVGMPSPSANPEDDVHVWALEPIGRYSVKSGYLLRLGLKEQA